MKTDKSYLKVICPTCGAWKDSRCKHTTKAKKNKVRSEPHSDRVRLAKAKLSDKSKKAIAAMEEPEAPKKSAKEKLTPEQKAVVAAIIEKIEVFGKHAEFVGPVTIGPIITKYRFLPLRKTKVAHLEAMMKDFAVALGAESVLVKRMPGESAVGVFVPNKVRKDINFRDTISAVSDYMQEDTKDGHVPIPLNFGMNSDGYPFVDDLTMQPHLMVAGTTGGGKSTWAHGAILSMAWVLGPDELKIIISDTKGVEFKMFAGLPHLKVSSMVNAICTNVYQTMAALEWCVKEAQRRLDLIGLEDVRNIHEYNKKVPKEKRIPMVVVLIDELADIIGPALDNSEAKANSGKLSVIVGRARASGIHVIACTQRPDVRLIKGNIKANFASRLAFRLPSYQDSRTVLATKGAEGLMSRGDMLYSSSMSPELKRLHAPFTSLADVKLTVEGIIARYDMEEEEKANAVLENKSSHSLTQ